MPDENATTHRETEWTVNGKCTGKAEIPLTSNGEKQVKGTGEILVGSGKLIDLAKLAHIFCSPRQRAVDTLGMLLGSEKKGELEAGGKVTITEGIAEWDYGTYEGKTPAEIETRERSRAGLNGIFGLEDVRMESIFFLKVKNIDERLDSLITEIKKIQEPFIHGGTAPDVLVVAHGHILRAFTKRWLEYPMEFNLAMMMEPGAICIMSYAHHSITEPAILVGTGFPPRTRRVHYINQET